MHVAYLDGFAGIAGDMFTAALIDAGVPFEEVRAVLAGLGLEGFQVELEEVTRASIRAAQFQVHVRENEHVHRGLDDIVAILSRAQLDDVVRKNAERVFTHLAHAEARAHGIEVQRVHFHEVGAIDAIVDVVAGCFCVHRLGIETLFVSPLQLGSGFVACAHGQMPVPTPGALGALIGREVLLGGPSGERTTPTGAALVAVLGTQAPEGLRMTPHAVGHGAGSRDDGAFPNFARVIVGTAVSHGHEDEKVFQFETNVDHISPEQLGHALERVLAAGALDVWAQPVQMKKGRPAWIFGALATRAAREAVEDALFRETRTLGVRSWETRRRVLPRDVVSLETSLGTVRIKRFRLPGGVVGARPEFEDVARIARETGRSYPDVLEEIEGAMRRECSSLEGEFVAREGGMVSGGHRHAAHHHHDHHGQDHHG